MRRLSALALLAAAIPSAAQPPERKLISLDPAFAGLIDPAAKIELIAGTQHKFVWTEGAAWDRKAGRVLFSDIPNNRVCSWSEKDGLKDFLKPSGYTGTAPFTGKE